MQKGIHHHVNHLHHIGFVEDQLDTRQQTFHMCRQQFFAVVIKLYCTNLATSSAANASGECRVMEARRLPWTTASAHWEVVVIRGPAHDYAGGWYMIGC